MVVLPFFITTLTNTTLVPGDFELKVLILLDYFWKKMSWFSPNATFIQG